MTTTRDDEPSSEVALETPIARLPVTAEGRSSAAFEPFDWALIAIASAVWGSSFLLIAEGLETLEPGVVAFGRLAFGFLALTLVPRARRTRIDPVDRPRIAALGFVWLAVPMVLFPVAEQWVSSAVAGMLNGAVPLMAALIASLLLRRAPGRNQIAGLVVGFLGVFAISLPSMQGGSRTALGASLVLVAIVSYGFAGNFVVPLQQRYGSLAVIWRAQIYGLVFGAVRPRRGSRFVAGVETGGCRGSARGPGHGVGVCRRRDTVRARRRDSRLGDRLPHSGRRPRARGCVPRRARRRPGDRRARFRARRCLAHEPGGTLTRRRPSSMTAPPMVVSRRPRKLDA